MYFDHDTAISDPEGRVFINITPTEDREETISMEGWEEDDEQIDFRNDPR